MTAFCPHVALRILPMVPISRVDSHDRPGQSIPFCGPLRAGANVVVASPLRRFNQRNSLSSGDCLRPLPTRSTTRSQQLGPVESRLARFFVPPFLLARTLESFSALPAAFLFGSCFLDWGNRQHVPSMPS